MLRLMLLVAVLQTPATSPARQTFDCLGPDGQRAKVSGWMGQDGMIRYWPAENPQLAVKPAVDPREHGVSMPVAASETIRSNDATFSAEVASELEHRAGAGGLLDRFKRKECPDGQPCPPEPEVEVAPGPAEHRSPHAFAIAAAVVVVAGGLLLITIAACIAVAVSRPSLPSLR